MQPSFDVGDIVIISEVPVEEIQTGDIIQYKTENSTIPVIHRVFEIQEEDNVKIFITKGDDNDEPDSYPVYAEQIMGKAVFTVPKIGWIPITFKEMIRDTIGS